MITGFRGPNKNKNFINSYKRQGIVVIYYHQCHEGTRRMEEVYQQFFGGKLPNIHCLIRGSIPHSNPAFVSLFLDAFLCFSASCLALRMPLSLIQCVFGSWCRISPPLLNRFPDICIYFMLISSIYNSRHGIFSC